MTKEVLRDFPQEAYDDMLDAALETGVHIVHFRTGRKGGATIAWRRTSDLPGTRMVEVAMSFCSPKDTFVRRLGTFSALTNFFEGSTITFPIGSKNSEDINHSVRILASIAINSTGAYHNCF